MFSTPLGPSAHSTQRMPAHVEAIDEALNRFQLSESHERRVTFAQTPVSGVPTVNQVFPTSCSTTQFSTRANVTFPTSVNPTNSISYSRDSNLNESLSALPTPVISSFLSGTGADINVSSTVNVSNVNGMIPQSMGSTFRDLHSNGRSNPYTADMYSGSTRNVIDNEVRSVQSVSLPQPTPSTNAHVYPKRSLFSLPNYVANEASSLAVENIETYSNIHSATPHSYQHTSVPNNFPGYWNTSLGVPTTEMPQSQQTGRVSSLPPLSQSMNTNVNVAGANFRYNWDQGQLVPPVNTSVTSGDNTLNAIFVRNTKVSNIIKSWNQRFSGYSDKVNVLDFIERLRVMSIAYGVSQTDLHRCAMHLFKDEALTWYLAYGRYCKDWQELLDGMMTTYIRPDYFFDLESQIRTRRQKPNESFVQFISELEIMYSKLARKAIEAEKIMNARHNALPVYRRFLLNTNLVTMGELVALCLNVEQWMARDSNYNRPTPYHNREVNEVEAEEDEELCEMMRKRVLKRSVATQVNSNESVKPAKTEETVPKVLPSNKNEEKFIHCYKCGLPNYTTIDCPNCSKNYLRRV